MDEKLISHHGTPPADLPAWDGDTYAVNTGHHRAHDAWFLDTFPVRATDRLLDVGCGSGDFTATLAALVPDGSVHAIDPIPTMIEAAQRVAGPNQAFTLASAQQLGAVVRSHPPFDGVVSRATVHWIPRVDLPGVLADVAAALRPDGWLRIESGGAGNVPAIAALLDDVSRRHTGAGLRWSFLDAGEVFDLLEAAGFALRSPGGDRPDGYVRTVAQRRAFDVDGLRGLVVSQCLPVLESPEPGILGEMRAEVLDRLHELRRHDGTFDQTYVRLDLLAYRPST